MTCCHSMKALELHRKHHRMIIIIRLFNGWCWFPANRKARGLLCKTREPAPPFKRLYNLGNTGVFMQYNFTPSEIIALDNFATDVAFLIEKSIEVLELLKRSRIESDDDRVEFYNNYKELLTLHYGIKNRINFRFSELKPILNFVHAHKAEAFNLI
jgi:hypothetical protein